MRRRRAAASPSPGPSAQPPQEREPEPSEWRRRLERWDEGWCCAPRFGLAFLVFWAGQFVTYLAARSAFSGEANQRGALQDRMHDLLGYCDQAGRSTELGACHGRRAEHHQQREYARALRHELDEGAAALARAALPPGARHV